MVGWHRRHREQNGREKNLNIVALSPNPWNGQWVNRQQLLSRLAGPHEVLYSNGSWMRWDRNSADYRAAPVAGRFTHEDGVEVDHPGRGLTRWPRLRPWDALCLSLQARRWRRRFAQRAPLVAYLCHPMYWPYVAPLRPDYVVYHCYDLYSNQPGWNAELDTAERQLLARADLVFSPTTMLSDVLMSRATCDARTLPNAADVQAIFAAADQGIAAPADLSAIPEPRIGYVGSLHPQLDLDLLATLAQRHPEWHFVLIGPEQRPADLHANPAYRRCRELANVHLLGERTRQQVPAYLLHMQANMMFYKLTPDSWTHVAYPLKLHEYMACGHPVVSVDLKMIREFAPLVSFAEGVDAWEASLTAALAGEPADWPARRRGVAAQHGWPARVQVLASWLDELPVLRQQRQARKIA